MTSNPLDYEAGQLLCYLYRRLIYKFFLHQIPLFFINLDKNLWLDLQKLSLDSDRAPLKLAVEAKNKRKADHRLSLIVKALNPKHQNPAGIRVMMPKAWKLDGRITSRTNEDNMVQFFFRHEHQLNQPWNYRDWMLVVD
ncbi:hypothetical protein EUTSA_v10002885mg [Eutrema salsugineum]|uniref:DUF4283 domain-containing protein n=1 Tax=Eutrema salsugineum TaxID=72664 RepID=V4L3N8_EUTSA|nr:hypothetical protein EUTSA_v10002885mg [Eutrema salsugineum]